MVRELALKLVNKVLRGEVTLEQVREKYCGGNYNKYLEWYHTYYEKVRATKYDLDKLKETLTIASAMHTRILTLQRSFAELERDIADISNIFKNADKDAALFEYSSNVREKLRTEDYFSRIETNATFSTPSNEGPLFDYKNAMAELKVQMDVAAINQHEMRIRQTLEQLKEKDVELYQLFVLIGVF